MLQKLLVASFLICSTYGAFAAESPIGKYKYDKEIMVMSDTKETCEEQNGSWQIDEEACLYETSDMAEVKKNGKDFKLHISTIGSNYHTCEFDGPAKLEKETLVSKVKAEEYDSNSDSMIQVTCVVHAKIKNGVMNVKTNQHCQSFCGANAWLESTDLKKIKE